MNPEQYKVEKSLGEGAYGVVELVSDLTQPETPFLVRKCVKKEIPEGFWEREIDIMRAINEMNSDHLIKFIQADENCILMNYVVGYNLREYFNQFPDQAHESSLSENLLHQLIPVMNQLYDMNIVHRDIKMENIIYNPATQWFTLIDFGLSCIHEDPVCINVIAGTPYYTSPRIYDKRFFNRLPLVWSDYAKNDIFALGVCVWFLLHRRDPPMTMIKLQLPKRIINKYDINTKKSWDRPDTPSWLKDVTFKMLSGLLTVKDIITHYPMLRY